MKLSLPTMILYPIFSVLYAPSFNVVLMLLLDRYPNLDNNQGVFQVALAFVAFNALVINLINKYSKLNNGAIKYTLSFLATLGGMVVHYLIIDIKQLPSLWYIYLLNSVCALASLFMVVWLAKKMIKLANGKSQQ